jgi:hypothetical protein
MLIFQIFKLILKKQIFFYSAYQNNDISEFELILKQNQNMMEDPFIREHIEGNTRLFCPRMIKKRFQIYDVTKFKQ